MCLPFHSKAKTVLYQASWQWVVKKFGDARCERLDYMPHSDLSILNLKIELFDCMLPWYMDKRDHRSPSFTPCAPLL